MTFSQLKERLARNVQRSDLEDSYGDFINEALREIQNRRSFSLMKKSVELVIPAGSGRETVSLPEDFKELQKQPAVSYKTDEGDFIPAEVVFEEQQEYRVWAFGGTPIPTWPPRLYFEKNADGAVLGLIEPLTQDFTVRVKYYGYLPELTEDEDTSPLESAYPQMVLNKAKAIAFAEVNDDIAAGFESFFEKKLAEAVRQDAYSEVNGRVLRM